MATCIVGIDPSLSGTGVCLMIGNDVVDCNVFTSDKSENVCQRCRAIAVSIRRILEKQPVDDVIAVIEQPGGALQGQAGDLRTLFWFIVEELTTWEHATVSIYSMAPNGLTKWVTGSGNAKAGDKAYHVSQKYMKLLPSEFHATDATKPKGLMRWADLWDGLCLCLVGRQYMGLDEGNQKQKEAVQGVKKIV